MSINNRAADSPRLRSLNNDQYEVEGFTIADQAKLHDIELPHVSNSGEVQTHLLLLTFYSIPSDVQVPFATIDAHHVFVQLSKLFCFMFLHEQTERSNQNGKSKTRRLLLR